MTLSQLKVGDKALVCIGNTPIAIANVTEITPEGFIKVGGDLYTPGGNLKEITDHDDQYIQVPTPEHAERVERRELLRKIDGANLRQLSVATLRKIVAVLDNA